MSSALGTSPDAQVSVSSASLRVLVVSTADTGGGAELSAWQLFNNYRARGYESWLAVGKKRTNDERVVVIPGDSSRTNWARFWIRAADRVESVRVRGAARGGNLLRCVGEPRRRFDIRQGREDFDYPGTWRLLDLVGPEIDIIHCYNLHGGYFDLTALPWLSHARPLILDLRDAWLLSGHCAHSLDCERWKTGCGECPYLGLYPAISRDATASNWLRKRDIFIRSRLYVTTPSEWLMTKVRASMLAPAIRKSRVITTGIDLTTFQPADKATVRQRLDLPLDATVLVCAANGLRGNDWKDYATLRDAVGLVSTGLRGRRVVFVALGDSGPVERIGEAHVRFVPYLQSPSDVASYYQAADVYVHAAAADTFPRAILEALACGKPVVGTRVGGIPEQIRSFDNAGVREATGVLVPPRAPDAIAAAVEMLVEDPALSQKLAENAAADARERFDLVRQTDKYLEWYHEILESTHGKRG